MNDEQPVKTPSASNRLFDSLSAVWALIVSLIAPLQDAFAAEPVATYGLCICVAFHTHWAGIASLRSLEVDVVSVLGDCLEQLFFSARVLIALEEPEQLVSPEVSDHVVWDLALQEALRAVARLVQFESGGIQQTC